ncbi:DALR anticodon-binding domain-containing protein 3 [Chelonus insularis]|uniref:DALR anticodon-binding domain-containing protein 3 n=1 Tax=Chelonus insularis TaxID=460826 RepID=UPI00158EEF2B|nr:DALR anticodon-binding domain-containing protein 3 [Chelonus insularis]
MNTDQLMRNILKELVGKSGAENLKIIKINVNNLSKYGELSFPTNILAWKSLIEFDKYIEITKNKTNILEIYLKINNINKENCSDNQIITEALNLLISNSKCWPVSLQSGFIHKEKICLRLNRLSVISTAIKIAIKYNHEYGRTSGTDVNKQSGKTVYLEVNEDPESNLTTSRLRLLKSISENIFNLQGYDVQISESNNDKIDFKYLLTTKSKNEFKEKYISYSCGVVKNLDTNSKETLLTYDAYLQKKIQNIVDLNECRELENENQQLENYKSIAKAIITFEFFSVKPNHPVIIAENPEADKRVISNKGGAFVLYNQTRISSILDKFDKECINGKYPALWNIDDIDLDILNLEEEWELIYNFIFGYPMIVSNSIEFKLHHELCPQVICSFLSHLSKKFSIYYRRYRILTEGCTHLLPTLMARIYLLKALQIVYNNSLNILNINSISRM